MITPDIKIVYLADHMHYLDSVAQWFQKEWHEKEEGWTFEETRAYIKENDCNKDKLNITFLALCDDELVGTIQIMVDDLLPGWEDKTPWLGSLYIKPEYREQGIAWKLNQAVEEKLTELNFEKAYVFTGNLQSVLTKLEFQKIGSEFYAGKPVDIFVKNILSHKL